MPKKAAVTPRKKPTQSRSKSTVDTILTAAAQILETVGFDSATTNRIAERAGVSIGSIYQYFPNKESLAHALTESFVKKHGERVETLLSETSGQPAEVMIETVINEVVAMYLGNIKMLRILAMLLPKMNVIPAVIAARMKVVAVIAGELKSRSTEVRCSNPDLAAFLVVNSVMGVIQAILYNPTMTYDREELTRELFTLARKYLVQE